MWVQEEKQKLRKDSHVKEISLVLSPKTPFHEPLSAVVSLNSILSLTYISTLFFQIPTALPLE